LLLISFASSAIGKKRLLNRKNNFRDGKRLRKQTRLSQPLGKSFVSFFGDAYEVSCRAGSEEVFF
jgi:hypothetical protein